jgi:hypothetical protein
MRENPVQWQEPFTAQSRFRARFSLLVLSCAGVFLAGCSVVQKKPSLVWGIVIQTRPLPVTDRQITADPPDSMPELYLALSPPPSPIVTVASPSPVRARFTTSVPASGGSVGKPEVPVIVPQLTVEESAAAKEQTNQSLNIAEKNLATTHGKNLSAAQTDLASKVRSFVSDARDAARTNDWVRARDLAKKAQVLSEELAKSL